MQQQFLNTIDNIILSRKPLYESFIKLEDILTNLNKNILGVNEILKLSNSNYNIHKLVEISSQLTLEFFPTIQKLKSRFNRNTVNIGVIGRAGHGKSTLLQKLTGLSINEIPSGSKGHCTGVKSIIENYECDEAWAEIVFYTHDEFLNDVLKPYFNDLGLGTIINLQEFERHNLPDLNKESALSAAKYEKLKELKSNYIHYKNLIGTKPEVIKKEKIREYVAQDNESGQRIYFNYLAVKVAKIFCKYPATDISKIALCDTPGLGDTGVGAQERLVEGLSRDVDFILFVKLPSETRAIIEDVDIHLYDLVANSIKELPINEWSMYLLNKKNNNAENCNFIKSNISQSNINTLECLIANCNGYDEAREKVLLPLLDFLTKNMAKIDEKYANGFYEKVQNLYSTIESTIIELKTSINKHSVPINANDKFNSLFDKLWDNHLTYELEMLLDELRKDKDKDNSEFLSDLKRVLKDAETDKNIPNVDEMDKRSKAEGGLSKAYDQSMIEMRAYLSQRFLKLDKGLHDSVNVMKKKVGEALGKTELLNLVLHDPKENLLKLIESEIDETNFELKEAFQILIDFDLSFRGLIQHRIRANFDPIYPDTTRKDLREDLTTPKMAVEALGILYDEVLAQCNYSLKALSKEPNMANYSIVEEFVDRAIRAKGLKRKWESFLFQIRGKVWSNDFKLLEEKTREMEKLNCYFKNILDSAKDIKLIRL